MTLLTCWQVFTRYVLNNPSTWSEELVGYLRPDGKTQVTVEYDENDRPVRVDAVVISTQHGPEASLAEIRRDMIELVTKPTHPP